MTRREITENRIIQNILLHNDPREVQTYEDIYVSTRGGDTDPNSASQYMLKQTIGGIHGGFNMQPNSTSVMSASFKGTPGITNSAKPQKRSNTHSLPRIGADRGRNI